MSHTFDFSHFPILETERLYLREMTPDDVTALLRHFGNPQVVEFIGMQPIKTHEQANEWLRWMGGTFAAQDGLRWGVVLRQSHTFIGSVGLHNWNREAHHATLGYDVAPPYGEQGYAEEMTRQVIEFGWTHMNLNRIEADIVQGNSASMKMLQTLGFRHEGVRRQRILKGGKYYDVYLFGLLRHDYTP